MNTALIEALCDRPLAMSEQGLHELADAPSPEFLAAMQSRRAGQAAGGVAVIPILGAISQRDSFFSFLTGGTSVDTIRASLRAAIADPNVAGIVFDIDSPGGTVEGVDELATEIRRSPKPTLAVANGSAMSAAYWLGSAADEMSVTPSGGVGSIGIWAAHQEVSKAAEQAGITTTLITAGKKKAQVNQWTPLSDEARASLQELADTYYAMFTRAVAAGRGVPVETVRGPAYGEGNVLLAQKALKAGMVDRVETLDDAIARVADGQVMPRRQSMAIAASDTNADLGSGLPFSDRLALVSAGVRGLVEHAKERLDMRAKEGRSLSDADRQGLLEIAGLGDQTRALAVDEERQPPDPVPEPTPTPPAWAEHARLQLALAQAEYGFDLKGQTNG